jgi:hypothetical protein
MHPYWIQKIEESRKTSVTTFWITIFLIVVVPLLLVLKHDGFMIMGIICFGAAGLRYYWLGKEAAPPKDQLPASAELANPPPFAVGPELQSQTNPFGAHHAVPTTVDYATQGALTQFPNGVPTNPFPQTQIQQAQLPGNYMALPVTPEFSQPVTLAQNATLQQQQQQPGAETVEATPAIPQKPLHFHDLAR